MPPSPNTSPSEEVELEHVGEHSRLQQRIKDLLTYQENCKLVVLKPYDNTEKEWEAFAGNNNRGIVTAKIKKFEERIQTLIQEDKCLAISRTRRKYQKSSTKAQGRNNDNGIFIIVTEPALTETISNGNGHSIGYDKNNNSVGNGTTNLPKSSTTTIGPKTLTKSSQLPQLIGFKNSLVLFMFLHATALYGIYLMSTGQIVSDKTIYFAFLYHFISFGVHLLGVRISTFSKIKSSKIVGFLLTITQPSIFKESYFEWTSWKISITQTEDNANLTEEPTASLLKRTGNNITSENQFNIMTKPNLLTYIINSASIILPTFAVLVPWLFWNEALLTSYVILGQLQNCIGLYISLLI